MKMKHLGFAGLAALAITLTGCQAAPEARETQEGPVPGKTLVVGADPTFRPISFEDGEGNLTGFDRDFAQALADEMGYELEYRPIAWDGIIPSLEAGNIDAITNMVVTEQRAQKVAFSDPYMQQTIMVVVRQDDERSYDALADLQGIKLGVMGGTGSAAEVEAAGLSSVGQYNTAQDLYQDLALGRIDAVVIESFSGGYAVKENFSDQLRIANADVGGSATVQAVAVRLDEDELLEKVNAGIVAVTESGTLAEIVEKWYGDELDYQL